MANQTIDNVTLNESLFEVFRHRGYEGATLSLLSEETGLKKSSLYHRFPSGKDDMVKTAVLHVSNLLHEQVIEPLLVDTENPKEKLDNMVNTVCSFYDDGRKNCLLNVLGLGNPNKEIIQLLNKDYTDWRKALIELAIQGGLKNEEAIIRAERFLLVIQGSLVIQRLTNNNTTFKNNLNYEKDQFFK